MHLGMLEVYESSATDQLSCDFPLATWAMSVSTYSSAANSCQTVLGWNLANAIWISSIPIVLVESLTPVKDLEPLPTAIVVLCCSRRLGHIPVLCKHEFPNSSHDSDSNAYKEMGPM